MRLLFLTISALTLLASQPNVRHAHASPELLDLKKGQTLMQFSASERTTVQQNLLTATLAYRAEDASTAHAQNTVNAAIKNAIQITSKQDSITAHTFGYRVYQHDPNRHKKHKDPAPTWRAEQSLSLKSTDKDTLLTLAGQLQTQGFTMRNLTYTVSPDLYENTHNAALENALRTLTLTAQRAAQALGKSKAKLLKIELDSGRPHYPQPRMMMAEMSDSRSHTPPTAAPGESDITLTVRATALLED